MTIGSADSEHITIQVLRRKSPEAHDYDDGNWVDAEISISIGPWHGKCAAFLRTEEFVGFRQEITELYKGSRTEAMLAPMEPWLELSLERDRHGQLSLKGEAGPEYNGRVFAEVQLEFDLCDFWEVSKLPALVAELEAIERAFPVTGNHVG